MPSGNAAGRENESIRKRVSTILNRRVNVLHLHLFADRRAQASLLSLPSLVIDEILRYLEVPDLSALCITCKSLRFHAHPRLYSLAHDYCTLIDKLEIEKRDKHIKRQVFFTVADFYLPESQLIKLEATFASDHRYALLAKKHSAFKEGLFIKMWSKEYLGSIEQLYFPDLSAWTGSKLERTLVRSLPNTSITQVTITAAPGRDGKYTATITLLGLLHHLPTLQKLTLDLKYHSPRTIKLAEIIDKINCNHLQHLVTMGTPALDYPLDFLPNLKFYEVLFDNDEVESSTIEYPSQDEGLTWTDDLVVLYRLRKANVKFRYQRGLMWDIMLKKLHHEQELYDHFRHIVPWMLECDHYFCRSACNLDPYVLDLWELPSEIGARLLNTVNTIPALSNETALSVSMPVTSQDIINTNHPINCIPPNTSTLDLYFNPRLWQPEFRELSTTVNQYHNLRHLILRFPAELQTMSADFDIPYVFLGRTAHLERFVDLIDHKHAGRHFRVDADKFNSRTGWQAAEKDIDNTLGTWRELDGHLPSSLRMIEEVFSGLLGSDGNLEDVTGCIFGTNNFSLKIV